MHVVWGENLTVNTPTCSPFHCRLSFFLNITSITFGAQPLHLDIEGAPGALHSLAQCTPGSLLCTYAAFQPLRYGEEVHVHTLQPLRYLRLGKRCQHGRIDYAEGTKL